VGALLSVVLLGLSLFVLARDPAPAQGEGSRRRPTLVGQALLFAGVSVYLVVYVVGEDDYRDNGISRWEAYDAHLVTVAALVAGFATCVVALLAGRGRRRLARPVGALGALSAVLLGLAFIANSVN
jgi:hypothetical protein